MKKNIFIVLIIATAFACKQAPKTVIPAWTAYDESEELVKSAHHPSIKMQFKLIQSEVLDKNDMWKDVAQQIADFSEEQYQQLKPLILEQDIPTIQSHIKSGKLSYKTLTQWYLYRIVKYENDREKMLNAIVAINPNAVEEASERDRNKTTKDHLIYGCPFL